MRVEAQIVEEDYWNHKYSLLVPGNQARRWATYILNKLNVQKYYISRRKGFLMTGDPNYVARYTGMINNDQHSALATYLPYAPPGVQYFCPSCS